MNNKFNHSIKVPRIYKSAARIVQLVKENGASVKQLVYDQKHINIKGLYALVVGVIKNSDRLDYLIRKSEILMQESRLDPWLARVLITELLWGKNRLGSEAKPVKTVLSYQEKFREIIEAETDTDTFKPRDEESEVTKVINKPRYVRVNLLSITMEEAVDIFRNEGWTLLRCGDNSDYPAFLATVASLSEDQFIIDLHVKDLLIFAPNTQFYNHYLYKNGSIVLQDKASCLAPLLLAPEVGSTVLDMCSAPGMKTTQLASIVGPTGRVFAVERDHRRFQTLTKLIELNNATDVVQCVHRDVLQVGPKEFQPNDVEYILVDPSCSGSGMLDRIDNFDAKCDKSRLQSLAGFQIRIVRHALQNFPSAKRVIYSTCSTYPEENEQVVEQVLHTVSNFQLVPLNETMKSNWLNFGQGEIGQKCLYAKSEQDLTNGFFIALFERCAANEEIEAIEEDRASVLGEETEEHKGEGKKRKKASKIVEIGEETEENTGEGKKRKKSSKKEELGEEIEENKGEGKKRKKSNKKEEIEEEPEENIGQRKKRIKSSKKEETEENEGKSTIEDFAERQDHEEQTKKEKKSSKKEKKSKQ